MIYYWKFNTVKCQIMHFAVYLYLNSAQFIIYIVNKGETNYMQQLMIYW